MSKDARLVIARRVLKNYDRGKSKKKDITKRLAGAVRMVLEVIEERGGARK
jgi:hypothetical protein